LDVSQNKIKRFKKHEYVSFIPYFRLLVFGHFSWVNFFLGFFPSYTSCLAKCEQRLRNIFITLSPKVTKNQKWDERNITCKEKTGRNEGKSESVIVWDILWNKIFCGQVPFVKYTQRHIEAKLFLKEFSWIWIFWKKCR
jgi:hypothetical protein